MEGEEEPARTSVAVGRTGFFAALSNVRSGHFIARSRSVSSRVLFSAATLAQPLPSTTRPRSKWRAPILVRGLNLQNRGRATRVLDPELDPDRRLRSIKTRTLGPALYRTEACEKAKKPPSGTDRHRADMIGEAKRTVLLYSRTPGVSELPLFPLLKCPFNSFEFLPDLLLDRGECALKLSDALEPILK